MIANLENIQNIYSDYPNSFTYNGVRIDNYSKSEYHYLHGWRNVVIPEITEYQKLGNLYILVDDVVTREVIDFTPEEIAEQNRIKIPEVISAMDLKLQLFELGITDQDIFEDIDSIPDGMFPPSEKQKAKIKYQSAAKFERYNADLNLVATMEGISQEQLDQIFINGNSR